MNDASVLKLVKDWEAIYKKGLLTFGFFLALSDGDKRVDEIKTFIETITNHHFSVDDQSMYRALRRYHDASFVDFTFQQNTLGPDWKQYSLTPLGKAVLGQFTERNITGIMYKPDVQSLLKRSTS